MIDGYAQATIVLRIAAALLLAVVFIKQLRLLKQPGLRRFKALLATLVLIIILANLSSVGVNFFRQSDGNLVESVRHINMLWSGLASVATGIVLVLIYDREA